jgi:hypothetical protein
LKQNRGFSGFGEKKFRGPGINRFPAGVKIRRKMLRFPTKPLAMLWFEGLILIQPSTWGMSTMFGSGNQIPAGKKEDWGYE